MERNVIHSCGHTEQHMIYGHFAAESDRKAHALARRSCTPCYQAHKEAAAEAASASLGDQVLPPLTGSEKQVSWAEKIRVEQLAKLRKADPDAVSRFTAIIEAKWWIDNRSTNLHGMASPLLS